MRRCTQALVKIAFATVVGMLSVALAGFTDARAQNPFPAPIFPPPGFVIPPADQPCILGGNRLDLQCWIKNDPDAARVVANEAALFQKALMAANSGTLDPFHAIETLGKLEIYDPNLSVNNNLACSFCHDPMSGFANGSSVLSVYTGGSNPGSVPITVAGAYPDNRIAKRNLKATLTRPTSHRSSSIRRKEISTAAISGMRARPGSGCTIPRPSRRRIRHSILKRWRTPTLPASSSSSLRASMHLSSSKYGEPVRCQA